MKKLSNVFVEDKMVELCSAMGITKTALTDWIAVKKIMLAAYDKGWKERGQTDEERK